MTEALFLLWPVVNLVAGVLLVWLAGSITGGLKFDNWGAAFGAVLIAYAVWWVAGSAVAGFLPAPPAGEADLNMLVTQNLTNAAVLFVFNVVSLAIAGLVIPGVEVKGAFGLLLAALALTAIHIAITYLPPVLSLVTSSPVP